MRSVAVTRDLLALIIGFEGAIIHGRIVFTG